GTTVNQARLELHLRDCRFHLHPTIAVYLVESRNHRWLVQRHDSIHTLGGDAQHRRAASAYLFLGGQSCELDVEIEAYSARWHLDPDSVTVLAACDVLFLHARHHGQANVLIFWPFTFEPRSGPSLAAAA